MPQNANTAPSAIVEPAAPVRTAAGLGGRSAVEAARAARRATRLSAVPAAVTAAVPDVSSVRSIEAELSPTETPPAEASPAEALAAEMPPQTSTPPTSPTGAPPARARRWQPTRGRRPAATLPATAAVLEPSAVGAQPAFAPEARPILENEDPDSGVGLTNGPEVSVFEVLVRGSVAPLPEPAVAEGPALEPMAELPEPAPVAAEPGPTPEFEIVAELGPGLRLRLRQLGYGTDAALAAAHPEQLRQGLGEISRMLNVEAWIDDARRREATAQVASTR